MLTDRRRHRIEEVLRRRQKDLALVLCNIHDPHNVSAILRSCDAFAVPKVHLYYSREAFPVLGQRSSASAKKWVERERHRDAATMMESLRADGFSIVATGFSPRAVAVDQWDFTKPTAIVMGNEHRGVDEELNVHIDQEIFIPMQGMVQSLNVSVAAAIILYEAWRQRSQAGLFQRPSFDDKEMARLEAEWSKR